MYGEFRFRRVRRQCRNRHDGNLLHEKAADDLGMLVCVTRAAAEDQLGPEQLNRVELGSDAFRLPSSSRCKWRELAAIALSISVTYEYQSHHLGSSPSGDLTLNPLAPNV